MYMYYIMYIHTCMYIYIFAEISKNLNFFEIPKQLPATVCAHSGESKNSLRVVGGHGGRSYGPVSRGSSTPSPAVRYSVQCTGYSTA